VPHPAAAPSGIVRPRRPGAGDPRRTWCCRLVGSLVRDPMSAEDKTRGAGRSRCLARYPDSPAGLPGPYLTGKLAHCRDNPAGYPGPHSTGYLAGYPGTAGPPGHPGSHRTGYLAHHRDSPAGHPGSHRTGYLAHHRDSPAGHPGSHRTG
jgi:hypothetical protein